MYWCGRSTIDHAHRSAAAARMRPRDLANSSARNNVIGEGRVLRKAIDQVSCVDDPVGPPGTGKTTLAGSLRRRRRRVSSISRRIERRRRAAEVIEEARKLAGSRTSAPCCSSTYHRFNRRSRTVVLPYVENGEYVARATTENPSFEVQFGFAFAFPRVVLRRSRRRTCA